MHTHRLIAKARSTVAHSTVTPACVALIRTAYSNTRTDCVAHLDVGTIILFRKLLVLFVVCGWLHNAAFE